MRFSHSIFVCPRSGRAARRERSKTKKEDLSLRTCPSCAPDHNLSKRTAKPVAQPAVWRLSAKDLGGIFSGRVLLPILKTQKAGCESSLPAERLIYDVINKSASILATKYGPAMACRT